LLIKGQEDDVKKLEDIIVDVVQSYSSAKVLNKKSGGMKH
jgi:hypothetical protein